MPTTELEDFTIEGKTLLEIMILAGLASSKGEGRRLIEQGGISVDGEKVSDVNLLIKKEDLIKGIKIKKGKKIFHRVILK